MTDARERLQRLIELAGENTPEKHRALAFELCDLLFDWPGRYPAAMREPFEALLEKVLRRLDGTTRRMIAARLATHAETAITLLNEFYLDMPAEARVGILARNANFAEIAPQEDGHADDAPLIDAARHTRGNELAAAFAHFLGVPAVTAQRILEDSSGNALAVACKGARVRRATFSALALLTLPEIRSNPTVRHARLSAFDDIPQGGADTMLDFWRRAHQDGPTIEAGVQAA
jgi:hypothetical protein